MLLLPIRTANQEVNIKVIRKVHVFNIHRLSGREGGQSRLSSCNCLNVIPVEQAGASGGGGMAGIGKDVPRDERQPPTHHACDGRNVGRPLGHRPRIYRQAENPQEQDDRNVR